MVIGNMYENGIFAILLRNFGIYRFLKFISFNYLFTLHCNCQYSHIKRKPFYIVIVYICLYVCIFACNRYTYRTYCSLNKILFRNLSDPIQHPTETTQSQLQVRQVKTFLFYNYISNFRSKDFSLVITTNGLMSFKAMLLTSKSTFKL